MTISFNNYAKKIGTREIGESKFDWYKWCAFVVAPEDDLDKIEYVDYLLDPSFPHPNRRVKKDRRKYNFSLKSEGWGNFGMQITIKFKDGTEQDYYYYLDLNKDWPENGGPCS